MAFTDKTKFDLIFQMYRDPGIPSSHPTVSAWQVPPHPLSETQSEILDLSIDFAIIGSGITGCSVAKNLLENSSSGNRRVTVFEARTLTSGATGRNGGHLLSHIPKIFKTLVAEYGRDEATTIARYCSRTVEKMVELAKSESPDIESLSEIRTVQEIMSFEDEKALLEALLSVQMYEDNLTKEKGQYSFISRDRATEKFHLIDTAGALSTKACAFWPYRFVTEIYKQLLARYPSRFSIETRTPITSIVYAPDIDQHYPYILATPRGYVRATQIFHCSNGFAGHLLPNLRGKLFPYRGTMSRQTPGPQFPNFGSEFLFMLYKKQKIDTLAGTLDAKLYHIHQNGVTGEVFCGGDKRQMDEIISSNDGNISATAKDNLLSFISKMFHETWSGKSPQEVHESWTGIIGMTPDMFPFVGKVPHSVSGRADSDGEWIAAGFNGYGMPQCWSCGEAIASMALGEPMPEWLPETCLISENRLSNKRRMGSAASLDFFNGER